MHEKKERTNQGKDATTFHVSAKTRRGIDCFYEDRQKEATEGREKRGLKVCFNKKEMKIILNCYFLQRIVSFN